MLKSLYGGEISALRSVQAFKWCIYREGEVAAVLNAYFRNYPSRTAKDQRLKQVQHYLELRKRGDHLAPTTSVDGNIWAKFIEK
jgi:hypothetical protein